MKLIQLARILPSGLLVHCHGIHDVLVNRAEGFARITIGSWPHVSEADLMAPPAATETIVLHFAEWSPDLLYGLFDVVAGLPEFAGGQVIDSDLAPNPLEQ